MSFPIPQFPPSLIIKLHTDHHWYLVFIVLYRWEQLKKALIEKRSKLGESHTLQQFSRDADEVEAWITEKLQVATDESYLDPSNIQSKHQKHQAFEAEIAANAERIQAVMAVGQSKSLTQIVK